MKHILVVDDNITNLKLAKTALEPEYKVTMLTSGVQSLKFLEKNSCDMILLDINMPNMDGFEVIEKLKKIEELQLPPIIFLTALTDPETEVRALSVGVVDFIHKPFVEETMLSRIKIHFEINGYRKNLEGLIKEKTRMIEELQDAVSISIADLVECRDGETGGHIKRTCKYLEILSNKLFEDNLFPLELDENLIYDMKRSAPLHDIGKVGIKDETLLKTTRLSEAEMEYMKQHTILGGNTLQHAIDQTGSESFLYTARDMAYSHHEKWDGTGYPNGLKGEEIPLCARIMAIADVYDALTSKRSYKEAFSHEKATEIILEGRGTAFEECIVDAFLDVGAEFECALMEYLVDDL